MKMEHYYESVPGWAAFRDLYRDVVRSAPSDRPQTFVEVGSWLGRSAAFMGVEILNSGKPIELHCVDPWIDGGPDLRDTKYFRDLNEHPFEIFERNVAPVARVVRPYRMTSVDAAGTFLDNTVDFLMLDGDHSYEAVRDDIEAWGPKMKPGSIISGDDYGWPGVRDAVNEAFGGFARIVWKRKHDDYRKSAAYWSVQL